MADINIKWGLDATLDAKNGMWGPYWYSTTKGVVIYISSDTDMRYAYTSNGGASWSNTLIEAGTAMTCACQYDQEIPGNTGTKLNIAWLDAADNESKFVTLDISDNTLGTVRTINSGLTISTTADLNRIAMTQTVSGNFIVAYIDQTEKESWKTDDAFATSPDAIVGGFYDSATEEDYLTLFPANTSDDNDCIGLYQDRNVVTFGLKTYDDSFGLIGYESLDSTDIATDATHYNMDGAVRHSDGHIIIAYHSNDDTTTDDLRVWDINPADTLAKTQKTNVFTNRADSAQTAVFIDQSTDDIYIAYIGDGWVGSCNIYYKKSTDGGSTWGSETQFNENAADDNRLVQAGRTVKETGKFQLCWYDDDNTSIETNTNNAITIGAVDVTYDANFFGVNF